MSHRIVIEVDGSKLFDTLRDNGGDLSEIAFRLSVPLMAGQPPSTIDAISLAYHGVTVVGVELLTPEPPMANPSPDEGVRAALEAAYDEGFNDAEGKWHEGTQFFDYAQERKAKAVSGLFTALAALSTPVPEEGLPRGSASAAEPEHLIDAWNSAVDAVERAYELAGLTRRNGLDQTLPKAIERLGQIAGEHAAQLAQINAMLRAGQGDDDGPQIMPDFTEGMSTADMVAACIGLLEQRRDVIEAPAMGSEGYVEAFYQIATLLGVPAQSASPKAVFEEQMLPRLKALVAFTFSTEPGDSAASALPSPLPSQGEPKRFSPEILAAHAQFGGDLADMQRRYDEAGRIEALEAALGAAEARADDLRGALAEIGAGGPGTDARAIARAALSARNILKETV